MLGFLPCRRRYALHQSTTCSVSSGSDADAATTLARCSLSEACPAKPMSTKPSSCKLTENSRAGASSTAQSGRPVASANNAVLPGGLSFASSARWVSSITLSFEHLCPRPLLHSVLRSSMERSNASFARAKGLPDCITCSARCSREANSLSALSEAHRASRAPTRPARPAESSRQRSPSMASRSIWACSRPKRRPTRRGGWRHSDCEESTARRE